MDSSRTAEEQAARWRAAGIPEGYSVSRLLYNAAGEVLVAELRGLKDGYFPARLVMRLTGGDRYEPIGSPDRDVSFESAATCEKEPVLVFNSKTWQGIPRDVAQALTGEAFMFSTYEPKICVSVYPEKTSSNLSPTTRELGFLRSCHSLMTRNTRT